MNSEAVSRVGQPAPNPYAVLGLDRRASDAEIKKAYFRLVREYPPEREPDRFQEIRAAYEKIRSPEKRSRADLFLLQTPPELPNRRQPSYDLSVHAEDVYLLALELGLEYFPLRQDFRDPEYSEDSGETRQK
jgi:curved DNA-binding protein CbpA